MRIIIKLAALAGLLYVFFLSITLLGAAFKYFGKDFAESLIQNTSDPFIGLFIGILATSLIQSSSTTTSLVVGFVGAGVITPEIAIPIVIGANIGTTVTNTIVAFGHITRSAEFQRAFAASIVHDFFNIIAVIVIFPLQVMTNFLGKAALFTANIFEGLGGLKVANPIKVITAPAVDIITVITRESGVFILIIAILLLFFALKYLTTTLKSLAMSHLEALFDKVIFRTAFISLLAGMFITFIVQSSSITTSLLVPLAGAGILTLYQIFPFTLGANVGTTLTAFLAALVTSNIFAVETALAHTMFNISGIVIIWPLRRIPIFLAEKMAFYTTRSKFVPVLYVLITFFLLPLLFITLF